MKSIHRNSVLPILLTGLGLSFELCRQAPLSAQLTDIPPEPSCSQCRIDLVVVDTLGRADDPVLLSQYSRIMLAHDGSLLVAPSHEIGRILRYDGDGRYNGGFGGAGAGPGEYTDNWNMALFQLGDTLIIADPGNKRVTYASMQGQVHRILPVPPASSYLPLSKGRIAFSRNVRSREAFGYPIHIVDAEGAIKSLTAEPDRDVLPGEGVSMEWRLGRASTSERFWGYSWTEYKLGEWSADGSLLRLLGGEREWLGERFRPGARFAEHRWPTYFAGVQEDGGGHLWILVHVVAEEWESFISRDDPARVPSPEGMNRIRNTIIEVLDARTGRLLARDEVDPMIIGFADADHAYSLVEGPTGIISVVVWRLVLRKPST